MGPVQQFPDSSFFFPADFHRKNPLIKPIKSAYFFCADQRKIKLWGHNQ
jgi:hypothetical protein